jgi:hypothetical protein
VTGQRASGRVGLAWCAVALTLGTLSGCAPADPGIGAAASKQLQATVAEVTQAAAEGDIAAAKAILNTLERQLREATASGAISAERTARIEASIALVRADLAAATPRPSPTPTPPATGTSKSPSTVEDGGENDDSDNGTTGKGEDRGKGGGKGKGK